MGRGAGSPAVDRAGLHRLHGPESVDRRVPAVHLHHHLTPVVQPDASDEPDAGAVEEAIGDAGPERGAADVVDHRCHHRGLGRAEQGGLESGVHRD
jgi:hypothetical protein